MPIPTRNTNRENLALDRKIEQFKGDKPVLDGQIRTNVEQCDDWESVFWEVIEKRLLDNAEGYQLDVWGRLVGEPREFRADADFYVAIKIRLRVQRSQGKTQDVLEVTEELLGALPWTYREICNAAFYVQVSDISPIFARTLSRALSRTRPLGVAGMLLFSTWAAAEDFMYTSLEDGSEGQHGYGSLYDTDVGGKYASVRVLDQGQ